MGKRYLNAKESCTKKNGTKNYTLNKVIKIKQKYRKLSIKTAKYTRHFLEMGQKGILQKGHGGKSK